MIYFIVFLLWIIFMIWAYNSFYNILDIVFMGGISFIMAFMLGFGINSLACLGIPATTLEETELAVYTNPVTNKYYVIGTEGEVIDTENFKISAEITEPIGKERKVVYDMGIWGIDLRATEYYILIPPVTISNPLP